MKKVLLLGMMIAIALSTNAQKNSYIQDEFLTQMKVLKLEQEISKKEIQRDSLLMILRNGKLTENQATVKMHPMWINTKNVDEIENELFFDFHSSLPYILVITWKDGKEISKETIKNGESLKIKGNVEIAVFSPTGIPMEVNPKPFLF